MYEFRAVTPRIERMRVKVRDRLIVADADKEAIQLEAMKIYRSYPPMVQKPYISLYVISHMPINVLDEDFFVGDMGHRGWGAADGMRWLMADIEHTWPIEADGLHHAPDDDPLYSHQKLAIAPEDIKRLREIFKEMMDSFGMFGSKEWLPAGAEEFFALQASDYGKIGGWPVMLPPGHLTPGFQNILKKGYGAIRKEAQDWLDAHKGNIMGDDMDKYMFYEAAVIACDGAITLTRRYADLLREKISTATPERAAELEKMAAGLDWIAEKPARTFWEALQQTMLYNVFLKVDNDPGVTSLGRFDQYTWPYLKKEIGRAHV